MKNSTIAFLHFGVWFCYLMLSAFILGLMIEGGSIDESQVEFYSKIIFFFAIVPSVISFYTFYFYLFPRYFKQKRIALSILDGVIASYISAIVGFTFVSLIAPDVCSANTPIEENIVIISFIALIALISQVIALIMQGFINWYKEIKLKEELMQKTHKMELALVKSQLDPHFLFNTINNIDVLILKNANDASEYLNKLSDIMRFMLFETKTEKILLSKEIEYIKKYIELQKIRTSNSNYASLEIEGNPQNKNISPMVFIPFIENAFKHTNNKKIENAITISILIKEGSIQLICKNKYDSSLQIQQEDSGLGDNLIRKRLHLIYPKRHTLVITNQNDLYSVDLTILNEKI